MTDKILLVIKVNLFAVAAWLIIHNLAFLGIIIGLGLLPFWLVFPKQTPCLICRALPEGEFCSFCRRRINRSAHTSPRTLFSAVANSLLIILLSLLALGFVWAESRLLAKSGIWPVTKTVSLTIPATGQYKLDEIFPVRIGLSNIQQPINAVQTDIKFDPDLLELVEITTDESFATVFIQKEVDNEQGFARLTGGLPNPGFHGPEGTFGVAFFKGKLPGLTTVAMLPTSLVLANDGRGSNLLKELPTASYLITAERISWQEKEQQEAVLSAKVLGKTTQAQIFFYEDERILGKVNQEKPTAAPLQPNLLKVLLDLEQKINQRTLSFWKNVFSTVGF